MNSLLTQSATALAQQIRQGKVRSRDVVDAHIEQIEALNPTLNALVEDNFEQARLMADAADAAVAAGQTELPPFHGVPCTIKESIALKGFRQTGGVTYRADHIADHHAVPVQRLLDAGFIPLGTSNVSEMLMWMEANNPIYGRTNNPYDIRRTAGGSSGGEGALVGSGASPVGLGSDIGGSVRNPAFYNGVFGHKPSGGLVDTTGHFPPAFPATEGINTVGPLARRAEDLHPVLSLLAGPDAPPIPDPASIDVQRLKVVSIRDNGRHRVSNLLLRSQLKCESTLRAAGIQVQVAAPEALRYGYEMWGAQVYEARQEILSLFEADGQIKPLRNLLRFLSGRSYHTLPSTLLPFATALPLNKAKFKRLARELIAELTDLLGEQGVLLYPSYTTVAPRHNYTQMLHPFDWIYMGLFNVLKFPATQCPLGISPNGLPTGIQVAALPGNDALTLAMALFLEQRFGGWQPPALAAAPDHG